MAKVKALKSFEFDGEIKNPWDSEAFDIPESRVTQFLALGLVAMVGGAEAPADPADQQATAAPDGAAAGADAPRRGRKPGPKPE